MALTLPRGPCPPPWRCPRTARPRRARKWASVSGWPTISVRAGRRSSRPISPGLRGRFRPHAVPDGAFGVHRQCLTGDEARGRKSRTQEIRATLGRPSGFLPSAVKTLDYKRGTGLTPADFDAITIALGVTANGRGKSTNAGKGCGSRNTCDTLAYAAKRSWRRVQLISLKRHRLGPAC